MIKLKNRENNYVLHSFKIYINKPTKLLLKLICSFNY